MIVVYDKDTGEIAYTIEGVMVCDDNNLSANEGVMTTADESIRCNTHKVVNGHVKRKSNAEIEIEAQALSEREALALENSESLIEKLNSIESRLTQLEEIVSAKRIE